MDGADWLRTQLTAFGCASCGRAYSPGRIQILAQREELFFVDLGCETCGTQAVAVVTVQLDESEAFHAETGELEPARPGTGDTPVTVPPVGTDDVLDMSRFLARFDGDFGALFRGREPDGS
ncbi:MAG: hypothetical protein M3472_04695 [Chloroflexota bacterium]|nr:hypothetical protein [Chloroflexota bacterium]